MKNDLQDINLISVVEDMISQSPNFIQYDSHMQGDKPYIRGRAG